MIVVNCNWYEFGLKKAHLTTNMRKALPILSAILVLSQGCYYDNEEELYEFEDQLNAANCDDVDMSFTDDIFPIIQGNCAITGCHVTGGNGILLENYNTVKAKVDDGTFRQQAVDAQTMPPTQPLTSCQVDQIESWLNAGALNN